MIAPGCTRHGVDSDDAEGWWAQAIAEAADIAACPCCGGPAPPPDPATPLSEQVTWCRTCAPV